ncbi:MAG TPA: hypothetical protein VG937_10195 [Polyangiaceae bacterium]|jgi:hypothetical protein|nr:hypothetical protein [Polyangiaceae bacterium]
MKTRMGVTIAAFFAVGTLLSCASSPGKDPNVSGSDNDTDRAASADDNAGPPRQSSSVEASANTCADRPCFANSDCCGGTSCSFDPERSHVQRYCL